MEIETFEERYKGNRGIFQKIQQEEGKGPAKSIEGWILFVTGLHPEAEESEVQDLFSSFGPLKHFQANIDAKSGFLKGYALVEYENLENAKECIKRMDKTEFLDQEIRIDFAFQKG